MPQSDDKAAQPKVPPQTPHRSIGDSGTPQRGQNNTGGADDDPRQAMESGDQEDTHRSRGKVIDDRGEPLGKNDAKNAGPVKDENWESGRHKAE